MASRYLLLDSMLGKALSILLLISVVSAEAIGEASGTNIQAATIRDTTSIEQINVSRIGESVDNNGGAGQEKLEIDTADDSTSTTNKTESLKGRVLALPLIITEPAIGEGLGAAIVLFHKKKPGIPPSVHSQDSLASEIEDNKSPESATGIFAVSTNNGTNGYGIGHQSTVFDDTYRIQAAVAKAEVLAKYYLAFIPLDFTLEGELFYGNIKRRLLSTNVFVGLSLSHLAGNVRPSLGFESDSYGEISFDFADNGIAFEAHYDSRDISSMPKNGRDIKFSAWRYDEVLNGDYNYSKYGLKIHTFHKLSKRLVFGARVDTEFVDGRAPFFADPYVNLRGIPALRYQGKSAMTIEIENRFVVSRRIQASLFLGTGAIEIHDHEKPFFEEDIYAYGVGMRYKVLKDRGAWIGLDIARGPEDVAWYFKVGQGW